jgi:hypothetical protein
VPLSLHTPELVAMQEPPWLWLALPICNIDVLLEPIPRWDMLLVMSHACAKLKALNCA